MKHGLLKKRGQQRKRGRNNEQERGIINAGFNCKGKKKYQHDIFQEMPEYQSGRNGDQLSPAQAETPDQRKKMQLRDQKEKQAENAEDDEDVSGHAVRPGPAYIDACGEGSVEDKKQKSTGNGLFQILAEGGKESGNGISASEPYHLHSGMIKCAAGCSYCENRQTADAPQYTEDHHICSFI